VLEAGNELPPVPSGWYAILTGHQFDLSDWASALKAPFDPVAIWLKPDILGLQSSEFARAEDASDVRGRARALVERLNGAMSLWNRARPVQTDSVVRVDENGRQHHTMFAEPGSFELRSHARAVGLTIGVDGKPIEAPPQPSMPQELIALGFEDEIVADMLSHLGRADNWYDIYKTVELAEALVGGKHKLERLLKAALPKFPTMRATANYHRHARAYLPPELTSLKDAKVILRQAVNTALAQRKS
jgi:hypothetical protein